MYIKGDSLQDTNMRYRNSFIRAPKGVALVERIREISKKKVTCDLMYFNPETNDFDDLTREEVNIDELDYSRLCTRYINLLPKEGCVLITRKASRNYGRSNKTNNTSAHTPPSQIELYPQTILICKSMYRIDKPFTKLPVAWKLLTTNRAPSRALSHRIAVAKDGERYLIYMLNKAVGVMTGEREAELVYKHKYFKEELEELGFTVSLVEEHT